jgi:hypothetical protein
MMIPYLRGKIFHASPQNLSRTQVRAKNSRQAWYRSKTQKLDKIIVSFPRDSQAKKYSTPIVPE